MNNLEMKYNYLNRCMICSRKGDRIEVGFGRVECGFLDSDA